MTTHDACAFACSLHCPRSAHVGPALRRCVPPGADGDGIAAERRLWHELRGGRLRGLVFERQVRFGDAGTADFFCERKGVVVELVGPMHDLKPAAARLREGALATERGLVEVRVHGAAVLRRSRWVLEEIARACGRSAQGRPFQITQVTAACARRK